MRNEEGRCLLQGRAHGGSRGIKEQAMSVLDEGDEYLPADFDVASEWVPELPMRRRVYSNHGV